MSDQTSDAMGRALRQMTVRYEALVKAFSILHQTDGLDGARMQLEEACTALLEIVARETLAENCSFMLLDQRSDRLVLRAAASPIESKSYFIESDVWHGKAFALGEGVAGYAANVGQPVRVEDTHRCDFFLPLPESPARVTALLCLPLIVDDGQLLGVLNLSHPRARFFTVDMERALMLVARRAAHILAGPLMLYHARRGMMVPQGVARPAADGIVMFAPDGAVMSATPGVEALSGHPSEHWCGGGRWRDSVVEQDRERFDAHRSAVLDGRTRSRLEYRFTRANGSAIKLLETASPLYCGMTGRTGIVAVIREAQSAPLGTLSRVHAEAHLLHQQRIQALGQLTDSMAARLGEHLDAVMLEVDKLAPHGAGSDGMTALRKAAGNASNLTKGLLSFSCSEEPVLETIDAVALIRDAAESIRGGLDDGIELHLDLCEGPVEILADHERLRVALLNLCLNARDALRNWPEPAEGHPRRITLGLEPMAGAADTPEDAGFARLYVRDNGPGIDRQAMDFLFEPFYTTKPPQQGAGLGLATVHAIVHQHGGTVDVRSEPGGGSTFSLHIPMPVGEETRTQENDGRPAVLLIDDEAIVLRVGTAMLERLGYPVVTARDGEEALERYAEAKDAIGIVICDENMPDMRGREVLLALRERGASVPFVISSGLDLGGETGAQHSADTALPDAWLQKPYRIGDVSDLMKDLLPSE